MEEIKDLTGKEETQTEGARETIPEEPAAETLTLPVKFNKEVRELTLPEATNLAQKGLKYEQIEKDYARLKSIAVQNGQSVDEYLCAVENKKAEDRREALLEQTGGNRELADYVLSLEGKNAPVSHDFEELKEMFPEINEIGELPEEVIESSTLRGKNLLDSYLRYLFLKQSKEKEEENKIKAASKGGIGPLKAGASADRSALNREFINGLWGK